ncbi:MAG: hypothetical protein E7J31_09765 [Clostridium sp.]|uniref:hypothetical protein n=1 Tax=Clostridium sp. TaxID=1506 RepID=UPI00290C796A|nr:hypothetical protein [Clostridium sp.]MDU7948715.1 hypothetical protein [Clostridium sp.]
MKVICKETVEDIFGLSRLFTKGVTYEFMPVDNKYSRRNNFVGYFVKDDEKEKRWSTEQFKSEYFIELN